MINPKRNIISKIRTLIKSQNQLKILPTIIVVKMVIILINVKLKKSLIDYRLLKKIKVKYLKYSTQLIILGINLVTHLVITSVYYSPSNDTDNDQTELGCNDTYCKLIELISKLGNPELKRKYTNKLKSLLTNKESKHSTS